MPAASFWGRKSSPVLGRSIRGAGAPSQRPCCSETCADGCRAPSSPTRRVHLARSVLIWTSGWNGSCVASSCTCLTPRGGRGRRHIGLRSVSTKRQRASSNRATILLVGSGIIEDGTALYAADLSRLQPLWGEHVVDNAAVCTETCRFGQRVELRLIVQRHKHRHLPCDKTVVEASIHANHELLLRLRNGLHPDCNREGIVRTHSEEMN